MPSSTYRNYEIRCSATKGRTGRPSIKWNCIIEIRHVDEESPTIYEITVDAWTGANARLLAIQYAKDFLDEKLGPEPYPLPIKSANPIPR